jgi:hypothetical protein
MRNLISLCLALTGLITALIAGGCSSPALAQGQDQPAAEVVALESALPSECASFKQLPLKKYDKSTLVWEKCLELKGTITLGEDIHLIIVAGVLRVAPDFKVEGAGKKGKAGDAADELLREWIPGGKRQSHDIHEACVARGNQCGCPGPSDSPERLWGKRGHQGGNGGHIKIVARHIIPPAVSKVAFNVSGGAGGDQGLSGKVRCMWNGTECTTPHTCAGPENRQGPAGSNGTAYFALGGADADAALKAFSAAVTPASAVTSLVADTRPSFLREAKAAQDEATAGHYDNRGGK